MNNENEERLYLTIKCRKQQVMGVSYLDKARSTLNLTAISIPHGQMVCDR